ncbi:MULTISPECIES: ATP-binding cassette domain-containing protein [Clostridium]|uniref:ATP-binding cassette domain-containing protein n=1 Tax=Clostridium aquiflavi TaxID=3073603 RepID=A0ABU1EE32_9CLOT|nr:MULTISPECIES: ATP-binding cassette domain-containing protein [unclassified Clostridium]MDR5586636.1 ATP-binding cassette domain-containing protein [Clostridium sp. 5N-1]NFG60554.1 ATP-binding cassette domain-containing protein [Clostridium botulinum]NFQ09803.1 ATP-binding cassette domain-containing protein [Clostridium botulinum]
MNSSKYKLKNVNKIYEINGQEHVVLEDISLDIYSEDITVILGASGCGKTTLLRIIAGLEELSNGNIEFIKGDKKIKPKVGLVFQESRLMPWLNVSENINFHRKSSKKDIELYLSMMRLEKFRNSYPNELSGGMAQRVSIARALSFEPDFLLMDEPFSALDYFTRMDMQNEVIAIHKATNKGVIFVTHDIDEALTIGTNIIVFTSDMNLKQFNVKQQNNDALENIKLKKEILKILRYK